MARADPRRVLAAQFDRCRRRLRPGHRLTYDEAVAEIIRELTSSRVKPGTPAAADALTMAAVVYAAEKPAKDEWYDPAAFEFLVSVGAGEATARRIRASR
jgi:hypothetical protein